MFFIKLLLTVIIFYIISLSIEFSKVLEIVSSAKIIPLIIALTLQFFATLLASVRWAWLMEKLEFNYPMWFYIKHYFIGSLFSQAMPSSIGGDAYRVITIAKKGHKKTHSFYSILIDRLMGLFGLLLIITIGLFNANLIFLENYLLNGILLLLILGFIAIFSLMFVYKLPLPKHKLLNWLMVLSEHFHQSFKGNWQIIRQIAISISIHFLVVSALYFIALSLGLNQPFWVFVLFVPISLLLTMIPLSFAGWGIRESAMVFFFSLMGAANEIVLTMSVIYGLILIITSLPASYFFLKK
jgi:uncharacterized protein (TIRG00374 family)